MNASTHGGPQVLWPNIEFPESVTATVSAANNNDSVVRSRERTPDFESPLVVDATAKPTLIIIHRK